jgi:hypothetical protein
MRYRLMLIALLFLIVLPIAGQTEKAAIRGFEAADVKPILDRLTANPPATAASVLADLANEKSLTRFVNGTKGDVVWIYCFYRIESGPVDKIAIVKIAEEPRRTLFAEQFGDVVKLFQAAGAIAGNVEVVRYQYRLKHERAKLSIAASIGPEDDSDGEPPTREPQWIVVVDFTNGGASATNLGGHTEDFLTGPREAWSFSADVPLTSFDDVEVDEEFENIDLAETPADFYVGLNYAPFGDALLPPRRLRDAFTLKALLKASSKPSDSLGVGIGLRSGYFSASPTLRKITFLQILDTLSPYVAYTRTKVEEDQKDEAGNVTGTLKFKRNDWTFGISLNLDRALQFVQGDAGGEDQEDEE